MTGTTFCFAHSIRSSAHSNVGKLTMSEREDTYLTSNMEGESSVWGGGVKSTLSLTLIPNMVKNVFFLDKNNILAHVVVPVAHVLKCCFSNSSLSQI